MTQQATSPSILWSCVARNDVILAKGVKFADEDEKSLAIQAADQLLRKSATPGWEFHTLRRMGRKIKGMKFHVYDYRSTGDDDAVEDVDESPPSLLIWTYACVYDVSNCKTKDAKEQIQSFLEKVVAASEVSRNNDDTWKNGTTLAAQSSFGPELEALMGDLPYIVKFALLKKQKETLEAIMYQNIEKILENSESAQELQEQSDKLQEMAKVFKKRTKTLRRQMLWRRAKYGLVLGTAITGAIATPTLIVLV